MASKAAARGKSHALQLRRWIYNFMNCGALPTHRYGSFTTSALGDEDFAQAIHLHLLEISGRGEYIRALDVVKFVSSEEMRHYLGGKVTISERTARRWMNEMEWRYGKVSKGMYIDGHERADVVQYRIAFLARWLEYERRMQVFDRDGNVVRNPKLTVKPGEVERRLVLYTHDESTFYANDRRKTKWNHKDEPCKPQPKGEGESLMVADFLSPEFGRLKHEDGEARVLFRAGTRRDGWFDGDNIIDQAELAMDVFEQRHPFCQMLAMYDNATTHLRRPPDGLTAYKMVLNPKREWFPKKDGVRMRDGTLPGDVRQPLYFPDDHATMPGWFKGMREILKERGKWRPGMLAECEKFKCGEGKTNCCARRTLFNEPDFAAQRSHLEEAFAARGHICDFYPKFHCELNFIEQYWGDAKRMYRMTEATTGTAEMEQNVVHCLDSVPSERILRFANRSARFMDAYRKGLSGPQAAWANRQYHGHRVLPERIMQEIENMK
ncbi:hypothetical protein EXIGLDRAFT_606991 [Exidia glandulosa HHB12029]|uniref:Uncharacterized protein n=1 Tax=Exidia glandulosa HHB12029 TaxID=1314781 RepID=A0A165LWC1_EXIGL|nr:hypothetical protein EXIGLDRAFT_606991 [Exidia glandulosa HHB12029]